MTARRLRSCLKRIEKKYGALERQKRAAEMRAALDAIAWDRESLDAGERLCRARKHHGEDSPEARQALKARIPMLEARRKPQPEEEKWT